MTTVLATATSRPAAPSWQRLADTVLFALYPNLPRPPGTGLSALLAQMRQPNADDELHDVDALLAQQRADPASRGAVPLPTASTLRTWDRHDDGSDLRAWAADDGFELALDAEPEPVTFGTPAAERVEDAVIAAALADGDDPWAMDAHRQSYRPPVTLSPAKALMTARLARAVTAAGGTNAIGAPGAATILLCASREEAMAAAKIILNGVRAFTALGTANGPRASLPIEVVGPDAAAAAQPERLALEVAKLLDQPVPVVVILTEAHQRIGALTHLPVVRIAPPGRDILLWSLRWTHSATGRIAEAAVRAALPSDTALAALDPGVLALALRAEGPLRVARELARLAAVSAPAAPAGPTLRDLPGLGAAGAQLERQAADLVAYREGRLAWSDVPSGILLHGAPGTGKTHVAKAFAATIDAPFFPTSLGKLQAKGHLGDLLAAWEKVFDQARAAVRAHGAAIVFIDEIDAVGERRNTGGRNENYDNKVISEILNTLGGVESLEGVLVIGAANHPDFIDPAILRSGRLGLHVEMRAPAGRDLVAVFRKHLRGDLWDVDLDRLAQSATGATMADVMGIVQIARQTARAANRPVTLIDLFDALAYRNAVPSEDLRRRIAIHEAGHAVAAHVNGAATPQRIAMDGLASRIALRHRPDARTADDLHREVVVHLAGRAAEEVLLGQPSGGGGGGEQCDLAQATRLLIAGALNYGHGGGLVWSSAAADPATLFARHAGLHDTVSQGLDRAYSDALALLRDNVEALSAVAHHAFVDGVVEDETLRDLLLYCRATPEVPLP
ncbi:AAA family ATPase [Loktanella sp. TSTF-M6]|uniref:AAA family ATPase n=1 Tax=Loktanella gaetbuli TaxID=2881335 RepID=A0ABS8BT21_9RHOB|nr:AAA family ATPase [Loktanella gaetbuli]MCB5198772.1 AAA family ATPase [Loktanella gaetbuli]